MMGFSGPLLIAVLLLFLILAWTRATLALRHLPSDLGESWNGDGHDLVGCPPEFVSQIFSGKDSEFISQFHSRDLKRLFRRERNAVALFWVQRTSSAIGRIMRQHLEVSRQSADLEIGTEARILFQVAQLKLICVVLFAAIGLVGPRRLQGAALYAERLSERVGRALSDFSSPAPLREMKGA